MEKQHKNTTHGSGSREIVAQPYAEMQRYLYNRQSLTDVDFSREPMNSITTDLPDYDEANAAMEAAGFESSAAEVHGTICGVLASPEAEKTDWLAAIMGADKGAAESLPKPVSEQLLALFQGPRKALKDEKFSFALFIPEADNNSIATRTDALAAWCRGFLLGLSAGGLKEFASLPDTIREALEDLLDIAEVVAEEGEDEQQEKALAELEEYVRVVVQLIYDDRRDEGQQAADTH